MVKIMSQSRSMFLSLGMVWEDYPGSFQSCWQSSHFRTFWVWFPDRVIFYLFVFCLFIIYYHYHHHHYYMSHFRPFLYRYIIYFEHLPLYLATLSFPHPPISLLCSLDSYTSSILRCCKVRSVTLRYCHSWGPVLAVWSPIPAIGILFAPQASLVAFSHWVYVWFGNFESFWIIHFH